MIRQSSSASRPHRLANRKASPLSKHSLAHAARVMAPTFVALMFASVAHAQGTMDFSGAQTLMGTFKTFAIYAGAVICFGGLIFAGIRMMSGEIGRHDTSVSERNCLIIVADRWVCWTVRLSEKAAGKRAQ